MKSFSVLLLCLLFLGCSKDEISWNDAYLRAVVLHRGMDCGDAFILQFTDPPPGFQDNLWSNRFYAINLPESFKEDGLEIQLKVRKPLDEEQMFCSMRGTTYPQIFILEVRRR